MSFKENLKKYREKAGYKTAKEFAHMLSVSYDAYMGYETKGREPKYAVLIEIAEKLGVSTDDLLGYHPSEEQKCIQFFRKAGFSIAKGPTIWGDNSRYVLISLTQDYKTSVTFTVSKENLLHYMQDICQNLKYQDVKRRFIIQYLRNETDRQRIYNYIEIQKIQSKATPELLHIQESLKTAKNSDIPKLFHQMIDDNIFPSIFDGNVRVTKEGLLVESEKPDEPPQK